MSSSAVRPAKGSLSSSVEQSALPKPLSKYSDLLTVDNLAEVLDVSTRTVYRLADAEELLSVKIGRRLYFPKHLLIKALCL